MLAELDAELADSAAEFGEELAYSAADRAAREAAACEIDRTVWLRSAYDAAVDDPALRLKLMAELRLTEQAAVKLLRQGEHRSAGRPAVTDFAEGARRGPTPLECRKGRPWLGALGKPVELQSPVPARADARCPGCIRRCWPGSATAPGRIRG